MTTAKILSVFTPTYNRAYCLHRVYESLVRQTCRDFVWIIIDDGSSDNTRELVNGWKSEYRVEIIYKYQDNQGMHGTYNTAYSICETELVTCIDSDDFMPDNAVELIVSFWKNNGSDVYSGLVGLDQTIEGKILGGKFPENLKSSTLEDLYQKHKLIGDKKIVYRTEVVKSFPPYPLFEGENFVPHGALFILIDKHYELLCLNEVLCCVEYMADGSTRNIFKQYLKHPKGFQYDRLIALKHSKYLKVRIKSMIHLISCQILLKKFDFKSSGRPGLFFLMLPFGIALNLFIRFKVRRTN